jgi:tol-pal system protein YbgF
MKKTAYLLVIFILGVATTAQGGTKEELVRLQADVLALQNQMRLFEKTLNERTDGIRSLVVQLNDQVGQSSLVLGKLTSTLETQSSGDSATLQAVLREVKNLSSRMDEANTRISALAQQIIDMKMQSKPAPTRAFQDSPDALSADRIYSEAYSDLIQGNLDLAIQGFNAFLTNFPTSDRADDAQYNIGEAFYNAQKYPEAVSAFSKVITDYATGDKVASALFKRGKAYLELQQKPNATADFKAVATRFPTAPEADLARTELTKLGVTPPRVKK